MGNINTFFNWWHCGYNGFEIKITLPSDILAVQAGHSFPTNGLFQTEPPLLQGTALLSLSDSIASNVSRFMPSHGDVSKHDPPSI